MVGGEVFSNFIQLGLEPLVECPFWRRGCVGGSIMDERVRVRMVS